MAHYFGSMCNVCAREQKSDPSQAVTGAAAGAGSADRAVEVLRAALALFYCWVTFAPLSRGTAACGYAALIASVSASGYVVRRWLLTGMQLDWEAILSVSRDEFIARAEGLVCIEKEDVAAVATPSRAATAGEEDAVAEVLLRSSGGRIHILNTAAEQCPMPLDGIAEGEMELLMEAAEQNEKREEK